jgi:simple sugar transport system substrate-binding protein
MRFGPQRLAMPSNNMERIDITVGEGISRREVMKQLTTTTGAMATGSLAGCSALQRSPSKSTTKSSGGGKGRAPDYQLVELIPPPNSLDFQQAPPKRKVTMVTHDASTSFFDPTIGGLHDATKKLGWRGNFTGPSSGFDPQNQIKILESVVDSAPDVIATTVTDPSSYDRVIKRALNQDISVILYNTNSLTRKAMRNKFGRSLAYVGQDQEAAGYVCGLTLLDKLPKNAKKITVGLSDPGHSALSARADGTEMAIKQNSNIEITERLNYTGDSNEGISRIENHLTSNNIDGIAGVDAFTWFIGNALKNQNMSNKVVGGGFDLTTETLDHINNNVLKFTIGQDPYSQGYMSVMQMFAYVDRGMPPKDYETGAEVIDSENINFAKERSGGWGKLLKWQKE